MAPALGAREWTFFFFLLLRFCTGLVPDHHGESNATLRSLVVAHDVPAGFSIDRWASSGLSQYRLLPSAHSARFALVDNGLLMTTARLDGLLRHPQPLTLYVAEDGPARKATHAVQLYVVDRRELIHFTKPLYRGRVMENLPAGTVVSGLEGLGVSASANSSSDDNVKYDVMGGSDGSFGLDPTNGGQLVTLKPLDREEQAAYDLVVRAVRSGPTPGTATCRVIISLDDENDNRPVFQHDQYHFELARDAAKYDRIGSVLATDADGDDVTYHLATPSNAFVVVPQTGELLLVDESLPTSNRSYLLQVTAKDRRNPSLEAERMAQIVVTAAEEVEGKEEEEHHNLIKRRAPRALRPTKRIEFSEGDGAPEGKLMFTLDKPSEKERFKIRDDNPWVTVEPSGNVRVKRKWDYEELGPEKTIDFWVTITNSEGGGKSIPFYSFPLESLSSLFCPLEIDCT